MTTKASSNSRAVIYAILVHVALIALLGVSLDWTPKITAQPQIQAMNAVVIDDSQLIEKKRAQQQAEQRKQENERLQALKEQQLLEEPRIEQRQEERIKEIKEKEREKRAVVEQGKIKKQQEDLREAKLKTAQEEQARKIKQADKQRSELEAKRKAEAERQIEQRRRVEDKRRIEAEEEALQEQLAAEQQRRDSDREKLANAALAKFSALIKQKVQRNWLRPQTARQGMSCTVLVRLTDKGEVLLARVVKSSGDTAYDRSVEAAVYKASPLPLPPDVTLFEYFREINFVFKPEG